MSSNHTIREFVESFRDAGILGAAPSGDVLDTAVAKITYDSKAAEEGTLFFCKGVHFKEQYLLDSIEQGAVGYVAEAPYPNVPAEVPFVQVTDMRLAMALAANLAYDEVWRRLDTAGITGTKGKSTTTYYVKFILDEAMAEAGKPESAILSTIENYDGVERVESRRTTPETFELHDHMNNAVSCGITNLVMEVSSQALKYHRTYGVVFDVGAMLNVEEDHISAIEHPTVEDYVDSKMIIFRQCRTAVINKACRYFERAMKEAQASSTVEKIVVFGIDEEGKGIDLTAGITGITKPVVQLIGYDLSPTRKNITFKAKEEGAFDDSFTINMPGLFNVENALAAIAICHELGIGIPEIQKGLFKAHVDGRMEVFSDPDERCLVIVDYAHNKMSMQALFDAVRRDYSDRKIVICYGCPGKKALGRRKELSDIAGKYADHIIITEEDPGEEDLMKICNEIAEHVAATGNKNYEIIPDRREAIEKAITVYGDNAVVLLTAKGRETRMKRGVGYEDAPTDVEMACEVLGIEDPLAAKE